MREVAGLTGEIFETEMEREGWPLPTLGFYDLP
jgi:hypothetical protein